MRRLGAVAGAFVVLISAAACSDAVAGMPTAEDRAMRLVFDEFALEGPDGVRKILVDDYKMENIDSVDCPSDQLVRKGATFTCTVRQGGEHGGELFVTITITSYEGEYQVGLPEEK